MARRFGKKNCSTRQGLYGGAVMNWPQGRRVVKNSHLSLGDAKANPFRALAVRGGFAGKCVFSGRGSSTNLGPTNTDASNATNGEASVRAKSPRDAATCNSGRLSFTQPEGGAGDCSRDGLGGRRRGARSRLFSPRAHFVRANRPPIP